MASLVLKESYYYFNVGDVSQIENGIFCMDKDARAICKWQKIFWLQVDYDLTKWRIETIPQILVS